VLAATEAASHVDPLPIAAAALVHALLTPVFLFSSFAFPLPSHVNAARGGRSKHRNGSPGGGLACRVEVVSDPPRRDWRLKHAERMRYIRREGRKGGLFI
jgi:hypothetical protein